jgi:Helicase associated domain
MFSQEAWNKGFAALQKFKKREGHCLVPRYHIEGAYRLGQWVSVQRYTQDSIGAKCKARLNKIGFVWSTRNLLWENGFAALERFKSREGHCFVPALHVERGLNLGYWVSVQRRNKDKMDKERKRRLNRIGFAWHAYGPVTRRRS